MRMEKPVICVFSSVEGGAPFWMSREDRHRIEHASDLASVERVVSAREGAIEYVGVILDRSVSAAQYLHLMTRLAPQFRGDLLKIDRDGSGVLSTCALREGRFLYMLDPNDVAFYLDARFDLSESCVFETIDHPALRLTA
jgi:hypothetical protein